MPVTQDGVDTRTPMGANVVARGATFRVWAPAARDVYLRLPDDGAPGWQPADGDRLVRQPDGTWTGFVAGAADGDTYRYFVRGAGSEGFKRDPYARELSQEWPNARCVLRSPKYPWHDAAFQPPAPADLVIYQFHIGTFYAVDDAGRDIRKGRVAKLLDAADRIRYWADLGVNAVEPLPIDEFTGSFGLGYNGVDYFSPEMDYAVPEPELARYVARVNALLAARGARAVTARELNAHGDQVRAFVDLCHLHGIAVLLDVVYNHAGGDFGDQGLYFFDRRPAGNQNDSLYFTDQEWAGGLVFAYWNADVRRFLADNARYYLREYHADGLRYDEVTVIARNGGWEFCQEITSGLRREPRAAVQIAEYWDDPFPVIEPASEGGAGFDAHWSDRLRKALRRAIGQAAAGRDVSVDVGGIAAALRPDGRYPAWRDVNSIENHDLVLLTHADAVPRIVTLADGADQRSFWARSRTRVANGLLLTAPGVPVIFMGQELLERNLWHDDPADEGHLMRWDGLASDPAVIDHHRFVGELIRLRRRYGALRGERINVFHARDDTRVLAFHRWLDGQGKDAVVVASLCETTYGRYRVGFPLPGAWREVFNSEAYDRYPPAGNAGRADAVGGPWDGLPASAEIVIPACSLLVFARD